MKRDEKLELIKEQLEVYQAQTKSLLDNIKIDFCKMIVEELQDTDNLNYISWTQYVQQYDDCNYYEEGIYLNKIVLKEGTIIHDNYYSFEEEYEEIEGVTLTEKDIKAINSINYIFESFYKESNDFIMKRLFGREVKVTIHKNGEVKIENEYR